MVMGRRKVKHEFIANLSVRRMTFRKRKAGLLKKLKELTTLCGIVACAIIFSTCDSCPDVWPSPAEAFLVLEKFRDVPQRKQGKYMMDQESYLLMSISKLNKKLEKQKKKNRKLELEILFAECISGKNLQYVNSWRTLNELNHLVTEKMKLIASRLESLKTNMIDEK